MGFRFDFLTGQLSENRAYGHQAVLARYCGVETDKLKIFGRYQHGFGTHSYFPDSRIRGIVWSKEMRIACEEAGLSDTWTIGSPIIYYKDQDRFKDEFKVNKKYSLCIAPHNLFNSNQNIFDSDDFKNLYFPNFHGKDALDYFANLCLTYSSFKPIILLYYKDFTDYVVSRFAGYGISAISLGDGIFDRKVQESYFDRKIHVLQCSSEVLVSNTSTLWAFAGFLEKSIIVLRESIFNDSFSKVKSIYGNYDENDKELFDKINGLRDLKSSEELFYIFGSETRLSILKNQANFVSESFGRMLGYGGVNS